MCHGYVDTVLESVYEYTSTVGVGYGVHEETKETHNSWR